MVSNLLMAALAIGCVTLWLKLSRANEAIDELQTEVEKLRLHVRRTRT